MQLSLIDLFIQIALLAVGMLIGMPIVARLGLSHTASVLVALPLGMAFVFLFTSPIYRLLRFRPMFLPRCPACGIIPDKYGIVSGAWPRFLLACGSCHTQLEAWFVSRLPRNLAGTLPVVRVRWPQFLGNWSRVR